MNYAHKDNGFTVTVLSETPNSVSFAPKGGGFVYRIPKALFQFDFEPQEEWEPTWRSGLFELEEGVRVWEGYTDCRKWNGFECPWFTLPVAQLLLSCETFPTEGSYTAYDPDKDCFYHVELGERFDMRAQSIKVDDEYLRVYEVSDGWCWYEAKPQRKTPDYFSLLITGERSAKLFLQLLYEDGLLFHPEDDPAEISNEGFPLFTDDEVELLRLRMGEVHQHLQDPCAWALWLDKRFEITWVEGYGAYAGTSEEHPASWFNAVRGFDVDDQRALDLIGVDDTLSLGAPWQLGSIRRTR